MKKAIGMVFVLGALVIAAIMMKPSWPTPAKGALTYVLTPSEADVEQSSDGKYRYVPVAVKVKNTSGQHLRASDYRFVLKHGNTELTAVNQEQVTWPKGKTLTFAMYYTAKERYERDELTLHVKGTETANASYNNVETGDFAVQYSGYGNAGAYVTVNNRTNEAVTGAQLELAFQQREGTSVMKYNNVTLPKGSDGQQFPISLDAQVNNEANASSMKLLQMKLHRELAAAQVEAL